MGMTIPFFCKALFEDMYGFRFGGDRLYMSATEFAEGGDEAVRASVVYLMVAEVARLRNKGYAIHALSPDNFVVHMGRQTLALVARVDRDVVVARSGMRETLAGARAALGRAMLGTDSHPMLRGAVERITREFRATRAEVRDTPVFNELVDWEGRPIPERMQNLTHDQYDPHAQDRRPTRQRLKQRNP